MEEATPAAVEGRCSSQCVHCVSCGFSRGKPGGKWSGRGGKRSSGLVRGFDVARGGVRY